MKLSLEQAAKLKKLVYCIYHGKTSMQINNIKSLYISLTCRYQNIGTMFQSHLAILKFTLKWILSLLKKSYLVFELMAFSQERKQEQLKQKCSHTVTMAHGMNRGESRVKRYLLVDFFVFQRHLFAEIKKIIIIV